LTEKGTWRTKAHTTHQTGQRDISDCGENTHGSGESLLRRLTPPHTQTNPREKTHKQTPQQQNTQKPGQKDVLAERKGIRPERSSRAGV